MNTEHRYTATNDELGVDRFPRNNRYALWRGRSSWAVVVHLNFRAGSTFLVPVCTVSAGHWVSKADTRKD